MGLTRGFGLLLWGKGRLKVKIIKIKKMKYQAFAKKENCWKTFGKITKERKKAEKEAIKMFKTSNAEISGYYAIPTKKGEWVEYVEVCKR